MSILTSVYCLMNLEFLSKKSQTGRNIIVKNHYGRLNFLIIQKHQTCTSRRYLFLKYLYVINCAFMCKSDTCHSNVICMLYVNIKQKQTFCFFGNSLNTSSVKCLCISQFKNTNNHKILVLNWPAVFLRTNVYQSNKC